MTDKEQVISRYPKAIATKLIRLYWIISSVYTLDGIETVLWLESGDTPEIAWQNSAKYLREQVFKALQQ